MLETKRSKYRTTMAGVCLALALALVCSGCGRQVHPSGTKPHKVTVIALWHPWGGTGKDGLINIVKQFNRTHPGIRVQPLYTPNDLGSNQKFFTAVAANLAPDLIFVDGTQAAAWAEQGAIQPLDRYVKRDGIKPEDYFRPAWVQNCYRNRVWALPFQVGPNFAFVWNKKVFREVGLDPEKPPQTIEELDRFSKITTKVEHGKLIRMGFIPWAMYGYANSLFTWGWIFGGDFYDPKANKVTANDPHIVKALEWMISYAKKYDIKTVNAFSSGFGSKEQDPFLSGQLAMTGIYMGAVEDIKRYAPDLDYGISYMPFPKGGERHCSWVGGWCLGIPKGAKHPNEAWEFIKWCCHDPVGTTMTGKSLGIPSAYKQSPYLKKMERMPEYGFFYKALEQSRHQRPVMPAQAFYMNALDNAVDYSIYGVMTPKQALDKATKDTQAELDLRLAGM